MQIFSSAEYISSTTVRISSGDVSQACRNFEKFNELSEGETYEECIDQHSMKVPDQAVADTTDYGEIDKHKKRREDWGLDGGCPSVINGRSLHPLVEKV